MAIREISLPVTLSEAAVARALNFMAHPVEVEMAKAMDSLLRGHPGLAKHLGALAQVGAEEHQEVAIERVLRTILLSMIMVSESFQDSLETTGIQ